MLASSSNIRVFVQWSEPTVFAGEDVECQITFKNVAAVPHAPRSSSNPSSLNGFPGGERQWKTTPNSTSPDPRAVISNRGHRSALSLNVSAGNRHLNQSSGIRDSRRKEAGTEERSHRRSVSIISLGISDLPGDETATQRNVGDGSRRPPRGHMRSSSLQIVPRRPGTNGAGPMSGKF